MSGKFQEFSKKLKKEDFDKAMELKNKLIDDEGIPKDILIK